MDQLIGPVAAILTTASFIPQVIQVLKTKNTEGISLGMYVMFVSGVFLWLIHGLIIQDLPVIVANAVTFVLASIVLYTKIKTK
jgi:MtN3 and saliva related transmembrane protein